MIGQIVHDYALGKYGVVIGGPWVEPTPSADQTAGPINWEWLVLYEDGELDGADTNDLKEIKDEV